MRGVPFALNPSALARNDRHRLLRLVAACLLLTAWASPAAAARYADLIIDANSGRVLNEDSADLQRYPASLTKMMTLYVTFEMMRNGRLKADTLLSVSKRASAASPSKLGLKPGDKIKVSDAIKALVTKSANDVAVTIAENLASTEENFARYMTWRARQIGMRNTVFRNASGLPDARQHSTARDLATLALRLHDDFPEYYGYFKTKSFVWKGKAYRNHNSLLYSYAGTEGMKTGYIRASGFNLVTSVKRGGKHVVGVVLGGRTARRRDGRMRELLDKAFAKASLKRTRKPSRADEPKIAKSTTPPPQKKQLVVSDLVPPAPKQTSSSDRERLAALIEATASGSSGTYSGWSTAQASAASAGGFHVQVGAYQSEEEAMRRLALVKEDAGPALAGANPIAVAFAGSDRTWYRARFTGFDRSNAQSACSTLKKRKIDCIVMQAD